MTIFGKNCVELVTAAWNTNKQDSYLDEEQVFESQDTCFKYLSPDDQQGVLDLQEMEDF